MESSAKRAAIARMAELATQSMVPAHVQMAGKVRIAAKEVAKIPPNMAPIVHSFAHAILTTQSCKSFQLHKTMHAKRETLLAPM